MRLCSFAPSFTTGDGRATEITTYMSPAPSLSLAVMLKAATCFSDHLCYKGLAFRASRRPGAPRNGARAAACTTERHTVRTHGQGQETNVVRRRLRRTQRRTRHVTGTAHVHPHARRATGARTDERPTNKTTVRLVSGTTTRRTRERASALFSNAGTRPRAAVATPNSAHARRGARSLAHASVASRRPGAHGRGRQRNDGSSLLSALISSR